MNNYYPIMLDIREKLCTIIGGGKVAERKILSILEYGAEIKVISPTATKLVRDLFNQGCIDLIKREYRYGDLEGSFLVYAATNNNVVNDICLKECKDKGILLNIVDTPNKCDFIVPSVVKRGDLSISISTNGKSPMLSKKIRKELERKYPEVYSEILDVLGELRDKIKSEVNDVNKRRQIFHAIVYSDLLEDYINGEKTNIKEELYNIYYRYKDI